LPVLTGDEDSWVRNRAGVALRPAAAQPTVRGGLLAALDDEAKVQWGAVLGLADMLDDPEVLEALLSKLDGIDQRVRQQVAGILVAGSAVLAAREALIAKLRANHREVRSALLDASFHDEHVGACCG
jgi:hypothetical protein